MKKLNGLALCLFLLTGMAGMAYGLPFSNTINWEPNITIRDNFQYIHSLDLNPPGFSLDSGSLLIRHRGNSNNRGEVWFAESGNDVLIGRLGRSSDSWRNDSFSLSQSILEEMTQTTPWSLQVRLYETTSQVDSLKLDFSRLSGNYTPVSDPVNPVPEPGTMLLLGSGLVGVWGFRYRLKFKK